MTLAELERLIESHAPGSLIPRDWLLERLTHVEGETGDELADLTVKEAGKILDRSPSTVREYCRRELLPGAYRQRGREWRIPRSAIRAFQRSEAEERKPESRRTTPQDADLAGWRDELAEGRKPS